MKEKKTHLPVYGVGPVYGVCVIVSAAAGIVLSCMTVLMKNTEEKWLYALYGQEYLDYCKRVNRCIPWPKRQRSK